jgi:hypothetical protein
MRLRGKMVRFYLPDVLQELREKAKTSKRNCNHGCARINTDGEAAKERTERKSKRQKDGGKKMSYPDGAKN